MKMVASCLKTLIVLLLTTQNICILIIVDLSAEYAEDIISSDDDFQPSVASSKRQRSKFFLQFQCRQIERPTFVTLR